MAGWSGVGIPLGARDFLFSEMSGTALGPTQYFIYGYWISLSLVKLPWPEINHPPPSSAEVKKE
jgi:hypothetical protein